MESRDEDDDAVDTSSPSDIVPGDGKSTPGSSTLLFCGAPNEPPPETLTAQSLRELLGVFRHNVGLVMRMVHLPSFERTLMTGCPYAGFAANSSSFEALRAAAFYISFCSLSDTECMTRFGGQKGKLLEHWRARAEFLIRKADLTINHDIVLLQALIFYVVCIGSSIAHSPADKNVPAGSHTNA